MPFLDSSLILPDLLSWESNRTKMWQLAVANAQKKRAQMKKYYDRKNNTVEMIFTRGDHVQIRPNADDFRKGGKMKMTWFPVNSFYIVHEFNPRSRMVTLIDPKSGKYLAKKYHVENVRLLLLGKRKRKVGKRPSSKRTKSAKL